MKHSLQPLEFDKLLSKLSSFATSEEARERLSRITPDSSTEWVRRELTRIDEVRAFFDRGGSLSSGGLKDIRSLFQKVSVSGSVLPPEELLDILAHLRVSASVRRRLDKERAAMPLIIKLADSLQPIPELDNSLGSALTPEATVRDTASRELSRLRRAVNKQQRLLRDKLVRVVNRLSKQGILRESTFSIRDGRYVLPVRSDSFGKVKGIIHDRSATGGTLFVEPSIIVDQGNELKSLELAERDEVRRILAQLSGEVRENIDQLRDNQFVLTELDCVWAKARLAEKLDASAPEVSEEGPIIIMEGRHPLLALDQSRKTVPLSFELGIDATTLIISGPNSGGKSVALKCIGLLCIMAGCGMHVPALPGTKLPLFEEFHVDIGDQQSIIDDLSTFTAHITRLNSILKNAGPRSLALIDEIGAGTDPQEGSSLSIAALEKLTERKIPTIVTTHHGTLKAFAYSTPGCANGSMEFDLQSFQPTYRYRPNIPGSSYALDIARRAGLSDEIIGRAREILGSDRARLEDLISSLSEKIRHYELLTIDENTRSATQNALENAYRTKIERLKVRERELKNKVQERAESLLRQARKTIEGVVKEIREKEAGKETIQKAHAELAAVTRKIAEELGESVVGSEIEPEESGKRKRKFRPRKKPVPLPSRKPEVGDMVKIDDSSSTGEVTEISSRADRVSVDVGAVHLWVSIDRLTVVKPPKVKEPTHRIRASVPDVPLDLDVRGLTVEEAVRKADSYLYDGAAAGRERLGIIHGKGAGVLARAVQQHLKKHETVKSFRFGEFGEGDYGVTVVTLKN